MSKIGDVSMLKNKLHLDEDFAIMVAPAQEPAAAVIDNAIVKPVQVQDPDTLAKTTMISSMIQGE